MAIRCLRPSMKSKAKAVLFMLVVGFMVLPVGRQAASEKFSGRLDYPLAPGTRWIFHFHEELGQGVHFNGLLAKFAKGDVLDATVVSEVTGTDTFNREEYVRVDSRMGGELWLQEWYRFGKDGLFHGKSLDHDSGEETLMVPQQKLLSPKLRTGESWIWKASKAPVRMQVKVVGPATITVPAGTFQTTEISYDTTVQIEGNTVNVLQNRWFAAGVGYVKQETRTLVGKSMINNVILTLEKFEPAVRGRKEKMK